jgi:hypothetical protein
MPEFDTPEPITMELDLVLGDVRVTAGERASTVVEVRPTDSSLDLDVRAAEQTKVERTATGFLVKGPRQRALGLFGRSGSVDVTVELPEGSDLRGDVTMGALRALGRLGECRVKLGAGSIHVDQAGPADLRTGAGAIEADRISGPAEASTGTGRIRLGEVDGPAVIRNSNGEIRVGEITGDLRARTANGLISVGRAAAGVDASTANGEVRVGEVTRGAVALKTGSGEIEVGISEGTAAQLDVYTHFGRVRNQLETADGPAPADQVLELRARTGYGDIVIRRP